MVATTTTSTRLATAPTWSTTSGAPVGTGDWRLMVERLNGTGSTVGACVVGSSPTGDAVVGSLDWEDLTGHVRGLEWFRGADEPNGRPRVGEILVTLDNRAGTFTPWTAYADTRPGTIVRAGLVSDADVRADGWLPLWCGIVDSWAPVFHGARASGAVLDSESFAEASIEVVLVETMSALARIDDNSSGTAGGGEPASYRFDRLLTAAAWKFGLAAYTLTLAETIALQSTDMSANRLTEMYLTADSAAYVGRSDVTGAFIQTDIPQFSYLAPTARLGDFSYNGTPDQPMLQLQPVTDTTTSGLRRIVYDAESVVVVSDPQHLVNDHRYARVGGTQQVVTHTVSVGRFGRSTRARADFVSTTDADVAAVATYDNIREARTTIRVDAVTVTATGKGDYYLMVAALDIGNWAMVTLDEDADVRVIGVTRSMNHSVTPMGGRVSWTATFAVDIQNLTGFPDGALLENA